MALITREADRMGRLVADLLLLARYDAGRPLDRRPVDLASLAAEAVTRARIVDPARPITLEAAEPVIVDADSERLRQVIDNLIGNAGCGAAFHVRLPLAGIFQVSATGSQGQLP